MHVFGPSPPETHYEELARSVVKQAKTIPREQWNVVKDINTKPKSYEEMMDEAREEQEALQKMQAADGIMGYF